MKRAAGILFHAAGDKVLLMRRAARGAQDGDHRGDWAFPGGGLEGEETPEQAARRECREETGLDFTGELFPWTRRIAEGVEFTTFIAPASPEFNVQLNDEHDAYQWVSRRAALGDITESNRVVPLHPGCRVALERFEMDELAVAKAMRDGELASPQRYMNMLLVDLRITGTGYSFRSGRDEFVWRDPAIYMNEEFRERCNGLTVVLNHPPKNVLDHDEYKARVAGSIFLPYLRDEAQEVWGIAKIHDMEVAEDLEERRLSTSPGVAFRTVQEAGDKIAVPDGRVLLIEGKPSLLDHLAICGLGVWDKGGPPAGVSNQHTEKFMPEVRNDDAGMEKVLDAISNLQKSCDAAAKDAAECKTRMDSMEKEKEKERADAKARADAEEAEKKARKDAEEEEKKKADAKAAADAAEEEEKKKADAARADAVLAEKTRADAAVAEMADVKKTLATLQAALNPTQMSPEDRAKFTRHQLRAEKVYQAFGDQARAPLAGESEVAYLGALISPFLKHSKAFKDAKIESITDVVALSAIADAVYADAETQSRTPSSFPKGTLIPQPVKDASGRVSTRYVGDANACWDQFNPPIKYARDGLDSFRSTNRVQ